MTDTLGAELEFNTEPRGRCAICDYTHRLKKDGTLCRHAVFNGKERFVCAGSGQEPKSRTIVLH